MTESEETEYTRHVQQLRAEFDAAAFEATWNQGEAMDVEQVAVLAISDGQ